LNLGKKMNDEIREETAEKTIAQIKRYIADNEVEQATELFDSINVVKSTSQIEYQLALIAQKLGRHAAVQTHLKQAVILDPNAIEPACALALSVAHDGKIKEAEQIVIRLAPKAWSNLLYQRTSAKLLELAGQTEGAIRALQVAHQIAPQNTEVLSQLAFLQRSTGQYEEALKSYTKQVSINPKSLDSSLNAAATAVMAGNADLAVRFYEHASKTTTESWPEWKYDYIEALRVANQYIAWSDVSEQLISSYPQSLRKRRIEIELSQFKGSYGRTEVALSALPTELGEADTEAILEVLQLQWFFDLTVETIRTVYARMSALYPYAGSVSLAQGNSAAENTRALRIGYISADFREHVMANMLLPILQNRDRSTHKVVCFATNESVDEVTRAFVSLSDTYKNCARYTDEQITSLILSERIDILVDLSGPTAGSRPGVLARKPAPVIITHIGAAGPIGLSAVDYKLTDAICDLPENQEYLIEKLLPMDGCCYPVPKYPLPTQGVTKADLNLETSVTIGAFYSYMKLSERCVKLWKRVLDEIPNGVLLFSPLDPKLQIAYENIMRSAEIPSSRFRFLTAGVTEAERLSRYRVVDFVLDSMPYGGVNGSLEALYMGVPVVTLTGKHHSERTTTSMLTHLGVTDTIAATPEEYIAYAKRLATDRAWRDDISTRIRARWPKFADPVDYARRWEALLRKVAK
jgi:protein O-GlcNAc transferase